MQAAVEIEQNRIAAAVVAWFEGHGCLTSEEAVALLKRYARSRKR
jgi:hypothetical protein